jgi:hypothetical protein
VLLLSLILGHTIFIKSKSWSHFSMQYFQLIECLLFSCIIRITSVPLCNVRILVFLTQK